MTQVVLATLAIASMPVVLHAESLQSFQVRPAVACQTIDHPPTARDATLSLICSGDLDDLNHGTVYRTQVQSVAVGAPRAYTYGDPGSREADQNAPVYPIRGTLTQYVCAPVSSYMGNAGRNCSAFTRSGDGICYKTPFGDWKCVLNGARTASQFNVAGPQ